MEWRDAYAIGLPGLDAQHQELFRQLAVLLEHARAGDHDQVAETLRFLHGYATRHFAEEEAEMAAAGFPDLASHGEEHARFTRQVQALEAEHAAAPHSPWITAKLAAELGQWLREHILGRDMGFGRFVRSRRRG